jgi:hypothetical protein
MHTDINTKTTPPWGFNEEKLSAWRDATGGANFPSGALE